MKIFKNIENGKLYILVELKPKVYTAIPIDSTGETIGDVKMVNFIPESTIPYKKVQF